MPEFLRFQALIGRVKKADCFWVEVSSALSSFDTTWSMLGLCSFSPVHDKARLNARSKASTEYSPLSLLSANYVASPLFLRALAYKDMEHKKSNQQIEIVFSEMWR